MRTRGFALFSREIGGLVGHDLALLRSVGVLISMGETVVIAFARFLGLASVCFLALLLALGATWLFSSLATLLLEFF
jgi:hypothetical protein